MGNRVVLNVAVKTPTGVKSLAPNSYDDNVSIDFRVATPPYVPMEDLIALAEEAMGELQDKIVAWKEQAEFYQKVHLPQDIEYKRTSGGTRIHTFKVGEDHSLCHYDIGINSKWLPVTVEVRAVQGQNICKKCLAAERH